MPTAAPRGPDWVSLSGEAFGSLLSAPVVSKTTHFVLHSRRHGAVSPELPTDDAPDRHQSVDKLPDARLGLALAIPKRHAKRAVTRNLMRRQMRQAVHRHVNAMHGGDWLIRLRAPFDRRCFPSAASAALALAVRGELDQLLRGVAASP